MSYSATGPEATAADDARRQNAMLILFFLLAVVAFAVRFCVSPGLMNAVVDYTTESGAFYEKLHFGTYAILLLLPVALFSRPIRLAGDEIGKFRDLIRFTAMIVVLIVFLVLTGRAGSMGFFIDTYLIAGAAGLIVLSFPPALRRALGNVVLSISLASALIGIFEAATHTRVLPYHLVEEVFRPTGLTDHPLTLGMMCAASIGFVALTGWRTWIKVAAIFLLFVGTAAAGARFALLLAGAEVVALLILVPWTRLTPRNERRAKLVVVLLTLAGGAALIAVLAAGGFLSRFSDGIVDENFYARTDIYKIFEYVELRDILFGADLNDILKIVNEKLKLPYIESTPVYLTFQLGAFLAMTFGGIVFWMFWRLLKRAPRPAWIGTAVFFAAALSNNTLSSKTPVVTIMVVLIVAFTSAAARPAPAASP